MTAQQGADELRIRTLLRKRGVGPDAAPPASPVAAPAPAPADWWDRLYADDEPAAPAEPEPVEESQPAPPVAAQPAAPARTRRPHSPRPAQSLLDAWDGVRPRTRWLAYHGTAAGLGWGLGITTWATDTTGWVADGRWVSPESIACYALGAVTVALYRRTRHWWWPVAWLAAVPASSIVLGVLLYAPNS